MEAKAVKAEAVKAEASARRFKSMEADAMDCFFGLDRTGSWAETLAQARWWSSSNLNLKKLSDYILEAETIFTCFRDEAFTTLSPSKGVVRAVRSSKSGMCGVAASRAAAERQKIE